ncbi:MAG: M20/M25/M40 family metallo-hydrolase [Pirellulaceae bacterium]|nr:M20/M25/M40 family metallo-hydrolase [Planctomycetales bacterium]
MRQVLVIFVVWLASSFDATIAFAESQGDVTGNDVPSATEQAIAEKVITDDVVRAHVRFLSHDLLEGRGPGSRGDRLAQQYIVSQFQSLGLKPAAADGSWFQPFPLVGVTTHAPDTVTLVNAQQRLTLKRHDDYVFASGRAEANVSFEDAELVFVGYGIVAPEYQWDDFKGVDLRGKVLVVMNNDPADDPDLFAGSRRLYYGRWTYKYEKAAELGAAGAIIIHTTPSAGYPYQVVQTSWSGEESELKEHGGPRMAMKGWFSDDAARRVVGLSGHDLDALRAAAEKRDFRPVPLGTRLSLSMTCDVRENSTANVLGILPGSDSARAKETVVFMAHHDHIGLAETRDKSGDNIYNGAVDNASGVAGMLAIARACAELDPRPARSIMFAAVGAEEQGLLGSAHMAAHPPIPAGYLAAVLNIDGINILGLTHDVNVIGLGKSDMDVAVEEIAKWQRRYVTPDHFPDRGYYYRSDQFSLAKIGVPGVYLHSGIEVVGKEDGWGRKQLEAWTEKYYHQTSDEYSEDWDLTGAVADLRLLFHVGMHTARQPTMPAWTPGDEFEAARQQALQQR